MKTGSASRVRKRRGVGRPDSQSPANVRETLLEAARALFLEHGFEKTTARQIAKTARTTPAMIHYYFGDKAGLFQAMLDQTIAPLRTLLADGIAKGTSELDSRILMNMQMHMIAANPWIPAVILNEVLPQSGRLRPLFIRDVAGRHMPLLIKLFEQGQRSGQVRRDLDPRFAALSFISLCMFPFVARAVVEPVFGIELDAQSIERFVEHTTEMFTRGIMGDKHA
jgi:TetR/AcrR family transcriptional regulator